MISAQGSVVIKRPVEEVWNFLTDLPNTPKWDIGVVETRLTSDGPAGLGTTFQNVGSFLGQTTVREYRVTEYEPAKKVTVRLITPTKNIQQAEVSYIVEPVANETRLTSMGWVEFNGIFKFIQPLLLRMARRDIRGDLDNLKRLLETSTDIKDV